MKRIENNIPSIYDRLQTIFPTRPWFKAVEDIESLRAQFFARGGQEELDNPIAFGLTLWGRHKYLVGSPYAWDLVIEAMFFAERVVKIFESIRNGQDGPTGIERRFIGALKNSADMRALRFELYMAEAMIQRNCKVIWPEETKGLETFDLLIRPQNGLPEFELECKSFAVDKGVSVKLADAHKLIGGIIEHSPSVIELIPADNSKISILTIGMKNIIPTKLKELKDLVENIFAAIQSRKFESQNEFTISHDFLPIKGDIEDPDICFNAANSLPGAMAAFVVHGNSKCGWKGIRVVWSGQLKLWKEVGNVTSKAAKDQLTGNRPGAIALQFMNDTVEKISTANHSNNKFRELSEKIFTKEHIAMLLVANDFSIRPTPLSTKNGIQYMMVEFCRVAAFENNKGKFAKSGLKNLFS
jgi:hypothetical protein